MAFTFFFINQQISNIGSDTRLAMVYMATNWDIQTEEPGVYIRAEHTLVVVECMSVGHKSVRPLMRTLTLFLTLVHAFACVPICSRAIRCRVHITALNDASGHVGSFRLEITGCPHSGISASIGRIRQCVPCNNSTYVAR